MHTELFDLARSSLQDNANSRGGSYRDRLYTTLSAQREGRLSSKDVIDPLQKLFSKNQTLTLRTNERTRLIYDLPFIYLNSHVAHLTFDFQRLVERRGDAQQVYELVLTNSEGRELDLLKGFNRINFSPSDDFSSDTFSNTLFLGLPDNLANLAAIGHEKTHVEDQAFKKGSESILLARSYLKKFIRELVVNPELRAYSVAGNLRSSIMVNVQQMAGEHIKIAQIPIEKLMSDPLKLEEINALLNAEARAFHGGRQFLNHILDFLQLDVATKRYAMTSCSTNGVEELATYVDFCEKQLGKSFEDWEKEVGYFNSQR